MTNISHWSITRDPTLSTSFSSRRRHTRLVSDWSSDVCFLISSRRRHTRLVSDWSSDVCSSDLVELDPERYSTPAVETISARYRESLQHPSHADREVTTLVAEQIGRASCRERV